MRSAWCALPHKSVRQRNSNKNKQTCFHFLQGPLAISLFSFYNVYNCRLNHITNKKKKGKKRKKKEKKERKGIRSHLISILLIQDLHQASSSKSYSSKKRAWPMLLLTYVFLLFWGAASRPLPLPTNTLLNRTQMEAWFRAYAPYVYLHPDDKYHPSSVDWFFSNGALLYNKEDKSKPVRIEPGGTNLPKGGDPDDGLYWLDLPNEKEAHNKVRRGDIASAEAYVHFKPAVLNGTFTDIQVWMFYPYNGHATAKIGFINKLALGKVGEHVGDWEHVTLRVRNVDGVLERVYFSQHSGGKWVNASELQFQNQTEKRFAWYSSRNGHAGNNEEGLFLQWPGGNDVGIRNDWAKSDKVVDTGARFVVVALEGEAVEEEPPWLNYERKWGPTVQYDTAAEVRDARNLLPGKLKDTLDKMVKVIDQVFGKDGPTGPKSKDSWTGDEK